MRVREVMTKLVVAVDLDTPVQTAAGLLARHNITAMPVIGDGRLVGMVSESDLLRTELQREAHGGGVGQRPHWEEPDVGMAVADVMTTPVISVSEATDTADVASMMIDYDVRSVPVVDDGQVVGIVSRRDLIRTLVRDDALMSEEIARRLTDYSGEPDRWRVEVVGGEATIHGGYGDANDRRVVRLLAGTVPGVRNVRFGQNGRPQSGPDGEPPDRPNGGQPAPPTA